jgi:L-threonylcarbamoyladenylate synthase
MIDHALSILRTGGVVGMPTETVYGLAADARRDDAVAKVFALKGRPSTNPLIVHVASVEVGERYAVFDDRARRLFKTYAPGALTIVLPLRAEISPLVTAGLNTVGIRIPAHPIALELLKAFDGPLAAPSANVSNHISPTTAAHVRESFGDSVYVLDGGACGVGIESTVVSLTGDRPALLRPGGVSREAIESVIGAVDLFTGHVSPQTAAASPGQQARHYAPHSPAYRGDAASIMQHASRDAVLLCFDRALVEQSASFTAVIVLPSMPAEAARLFYAELRRADAMGAKTLLIESPPPGGAWDALRDRIGRATRPLIDRTR